MLYHVPHHVNSTREVSLSYDTFENVEAGDRLSRNKRLGPISVLLINIGITRCQTLRLFSTSHRRSNFFDARISQFQMPGCLKKCL